MIQENIEALADAMQQVKTHCMCLTFEETTTHYRVLYPRGMCLDGAQVHKGMGKGKALTVLLAIMERHWNESGIH